ncbi:Eco57I restriction-modification methylase domain-containing protein [Mycoplasma sp. AC1221]
MNKINYGQVFTPKDIVLKMISLISFDNNAFILETSSGTGNFYFELIKKYNNLIALEIDENIAHVGAKVISYFNTNYHPDVIIGNPPYVDYKNIIDAPKSKFLIHKPNLYLYFLEKALSDLKQNGELIWIIPAAIFTTTSAKYLLKIIYDNFSITYFELIPENIWENAAVPTAIIKIVKVKNHKDKIKYFWSNWKILFGKKPKLPTDIIVKVGGASGFNSKLQKGNISFVVSHTERTKQLNNILYQPNKWIRPVPIPPRKFTYQIFVNCKTRNKRPFYVLDFQEKGEFIHYDASVLSIYVNLDYQNTKKIVDILNNIDWELMGIKRDGRYHFTQSILQAIFNF